MLHVQSNSSSQARLGAGGSGQGITHISYVDLEILMSSGCDGSNPLSLYIWKQMQSLAQLLNFKIVVGRHLLSTYYVCIDHWAGRWKC